MTQVTEALRLDLLAKLALAVVLGGAIGLEREIKGKPTGLRTNILICVGSALLSDISVRIGIMDNGTRFGDPGRIAAQIVSGIGFLGAGTIMQARGTVTGLTSAATIWVVAAIGMALGGGAYIEALGATLLVMLVLWGLGRLEGLVARRATRSRLAIHARPEPTALDDLEALVRRAGLEVERWSSRRENVDLVIECDLRGPKRLHDEVMLGLLHHPLVRAVSTGE